jgi:hypothetical protein
MASKDSNSLVISLSIFVLLSLGFGVAWYFSHDFNTQLARQIVEVTDSVNTQEAAIKTHEAEVEQLKNLIGHPGATDEVVEGTKAEIAKRAADASSAAAALEPAMVANANARDAASQSASDRLRQTYDKLAELNQKVAQHEQALQAMKTSLRDKEEELRKKEAAHGVRLSEEEGKIDTEKARLRQKQADYDQLVKDNAREIERVEKELTQQRQSLIALRRDKLKLEGSAFERIDGSITLVDAAAGTCYVNLGTKDELRLGTEFSVYARDPAGKAEGRILNPRERRGKIEIIALLGDHLAEARILPDSATNRVSPDNPISKGDSIFSSLYEKGRKLQIAVVGTLHFHGNPSRDREEFRRLVSSAGIDIVLEVDDQANLIGRDGELVSVEEIPDRITAGTRFLVVGERGDSATADDAQRLIYEKTDVLQAELLKAAENNGVYVLSLSSFLDLMGYSRKQLVSSPRLMSEQE